MTKMNNHRNFSPWQPLKVVVLLVAMTLLTMGLAEAWGKKGHRLVARLAARNLTAGAAAKVAALLEGQPMEEVAMWADWIKTERPETAFYHYVNFAVNQNGEVIGETCGEVVQAINSFRDILADEERSASERAEALKFIIHLVGDIHLPVHCSPEGSLGGNTISVSFLGKPTNLHKVWDSGLIEATGLTEDVYFSQLVVLESRSGWLAQVCKAPKNQDQIQSWARESFHLAVHEAMVVPDDHVLGERYLAVHIRTVNRRLLTAGCRLAYMLNKIFDPAKNHPQGPLAQTTFRPIPPASPSL